MITVLKNLLNSFALTSTECRKRAQQNWRYDQECSRDENEKLVKNSWVFRTIAHLLEIKDSNVELAESWGSYPLSEKESILKILYSY